MRKLVYLLSIVYCVLHMENSMCQVSQEWVSRYNGPPGNSSDEAHSIAVDGFGNVYVTGHSVGSVSFGDYGTVKYNSAGVQQWAARYNGPGNSFERAYSIAVDGSGNVYVTGRSTGIGTAYDYATIKYNSSGDSVWVQRYNGPGNGDDEARSIAVDGLGNVYVTGYSKGSAPGPDYATIKYNSTGSQLWVQRYNGPVNGYANAYSIAIDGLGNVYVTGRSYGGGVGYDYATIKYNSTGAVQWVQRYNGTANDNDEAYSITVDGSSNVYVTGTSISIGSGYDYVTIKYNSSGTQQWFQRYSGTSSSSGSDAAFSIAVNDSGNVYVTGESIGFGTLYDYATVKYNSSGVLQWHQRYNGPGNGYDNAYSIAVDSSGNLYVTGKSLGISTDFDYATIKYNSSGDSVWLRRYNGPGSGEDYANSIAIDGLGNVYVTGQSTGSGTGLDFATIKYSQFLVSIQPISTEVPNQYSLSQNYPNPFNPATKIKFAIPPHNLPLTGGDREGVLLKIYDILGREIATLVNEQLNPGNYEVEFDGANLPSGVYYYKLIARDYSETKIMILIK